MTLDISKEWCKRMARLEGDVEIGAGLLALDPLFVGEAERLALRDDELPNPVFGRFIALMRRQRGITIEELAKQADVDIADLVQIESDPHHRPELRTTYCLAGYFKVPQSRLMQVAGLTAPKDVDLVDEGVRFAARSDPVAELTPEEGAALEAFVAVLSRQE